MRTPNAIRTEDPKIEKWMREARRQDFETILHGWVADNKQTCQLGTLPPNVHVFRVNCQVLEAFNSDGTDQITVGWDSDPDALATAFDVSTIGNKFVPLGVSIGFNAQLQEVKAFYNNGGSEPTTGKAIIIVEFHPVESLIS